jgi:hypothetical protein
MDQDSSAREPTKQADERRPEKASMNPKLIELKGGEFIDPSFIMAVSWGPNPMNALENSDSLKCMKPWVTIFWGEQRSTCIRCGSTSEAKDYCGSIAAMVNQNQQDMKAEEAAKLLAACNRTAGQLIAILMKGGLGVSEAAYKEHDAYKAAFRAMVGRDPGWEDYEVMGVHDNEHREPVSGMTIRECHRTSFKDYFE